MPRENQTGPMGMGPMTGRGMGSCRAGYGRVMNGWFGRKYQAMPRSERKDLLNLEIEDLKQELKLAQEEMKELEK